MSTDHIRKASDGNTRLLKEYGGTPGRKHFAHGGHVHSDEKEDKKLVKHMVKGACLKKADGGMVDGESSKGRLDRPGRKMKGKDAKKGTNVNVIIMSGKDNGPTPPPGMGAGPAMPPPPPKPMMPAPPMAGPGGPPMPMHKHGGKVKHAYKTGGRVKDHLDAEGQDSPTEREAEKIVTSKKHGGHVHHKQHKANGGHIHAEGQDSPSEREAERIVESKKHGGKIHRKEGGPVPVKMDASAANGYGRKEKIKEYGR